MEQIKKDVRKLIQRNNILLMNQEDTEQAIDFVFDLMEFYAEYTEKLFPNATVTINAIKRGAEQVRELPDFLKELGIHGK